MYRGRHRSVAQQLDEISRKGDVDVNDIAALPRVTLKGRTFVLEDWVHKKGPRGRNTWIKTHGIFLVEIRLTAPSKANIGSVIFVMAGARLSFLPLPLHLLLVTT